MPDLAAFEQSESLGRKAPDGSPSGDLTLLLKTSIFGTLKKRFSPVQ